MENENTQEYYNAKPSKVSNIGKDVSGAKRMNFDTYETEEERETKEQKKATNKKLKAIKEQIKEELSKDQPDASHLATLLHCRFTCDHGFSLDDPEANTIIQQRRIQARNSLMGDGTERREFNRMINAYNNTRKEIHSLGIDWLADRLIAKMKRKYSSRSSFIEETGRKFSWKKGEVTKETEGNARYLEKHTVAVQFGNSVTDSERAYVLSELQDFIATWKTDSRTNGFDISDLAYSFGARGKAGSVAYYQPSGKILSVNRNNIGSIVHEIGHHLDYMNNLISNGISRETINTYRDSIKEGMDRKSLQYYCSRKEIFARAFEAYCFRESMNFDEFAQCGKAYLPELNEELVDLIERALDLK